MSTKVGVGTSITSKQVSTVDESCPEIGPIPGLIALYKLDEGSGQDILDSSGNSHDGFLGSSSSPDTNDPSRVSHGLMFDLDDRVTITHTFSLYVDRPFSIFAVLKADNIDLDPSIIAKAQGPSDIRGWAVIISALGELVIYLVDNFEDPLFIAKGSEDSEIQLGEYVSVLVTYDGSGTASGIKLYKNGVQITRTNVIESGPLSTIETSENISLGQIFVPGNNQLEGILSIVGVCDIELNQDQIIDVHNQIAAYLSCNRLISLPLAYPAAEVKSFLPPANGFYFSGQDIRFFIYFTTPVIVTGSPSLTVVIGGESRTVGYWTGSGTDRLEFLYTVSSEDIDLDGIEVGTTIDLNGGSIKNIYDVDADLELPITDTSGILIFSFGDSIVYATSFEVNLDNDQILKSSFKGLDLWSLEAIRGNDLSSDITDPAHLLPGISIALGQYYRQFGTIDYWSFIGSSGFSMHSRLKHSGGSGFVFPFLTFSNVSSAPSPMRFYVSVTNSTATLTVQDGTPIPQTETFHFADISGLWVTMSIVFDRDTKVFYLYINGELVDSRVLTVTPVHNLVTPALGAIDEDGDGSSIVQSTASMEMVGTLVYSVAHEHEKVMLMHDFLQSLPIPTEL